MSNLVKIYLDKNTGQLKAKSDDDTGDSGGNALGYTHEQTIPTTVWTVIHSLNTQNILYQIFNSSKENLIPDKFKIIDANIVEVTFDVTQTGFLQIISF